MRFLKLSANLIGRDFVVGDIHGCFDALMSLLDSVNFDRRFDRLFSVGDLIDRGPDSEKCLQLLFEPWFFVVKGNHENMFCDAVYNRTTFMHITEYFNTKNGGAWTKAWFERKAPELMFWAEKLEALPYVIHVEKNGNLSDFWVVHSELRAQNVPLSDANVEDYLNTATETEMSVLQWSRKLAYRTHVNYLPKFNGPVYCGHTPTHNPPDIVMGHWNLDGGAGKWCKDSAFDEACLAMACHQTGDIYTVDVSGQIYSPNL